MSEENVDYCTLCDGVQGPDHVHICASCGAVLHPDHMISVGHEGEPRRVYCNTYCHLVAEPDHPRARAIPADVKEKMMRRAELKHRMAALKRECLEEGVPWTS